MDLNKLSSVSVVALTGHIIFVIGSDTPSKICSGNSSDILEKLVNDLKYTDYMSAVNNMTILPDWTRIIQNSMKLSRLIKH
jgi:hypothetical protein